MSQMKIQASSRHWGGQELSEKNRKSTGTSLKCQQWDCIKLNSFCTAKVAISRAHRQPAEWGEIYQLHLRQGANNQN